MGLLFSVLEFPFRASKSLGMTSCVPFRHLFWWSLNSFFNAFWLLIDVLQVMANGPSFVWLIWSFLNVESDQRDEINEMLNR